MQMARLLQQAGQKAPAVKPVLELNPEHALVKRLQQQGMASQNQDESEFTNLVHILFDQALISDGGTLADPVAYVKRVNSCLLMR